MSLGDVFPLRCHSAIYGAFGNSYAGNPSSFHDIPLGELYAGRPAVTFARQLVEAPLTCIEYVVSMSWFIFSIQTTPRQFYACLEAFVPDWRERRQALNDYTYR